MLLTLTTEVRAAGAEFLYILNGDLIYQYRLGPQGQAVALSAPQTMPAGVIAKGSSSIAACTTRPFVYVFSYNAPSENSKVSLIHAFRVQHDGHLVYQDAVTVKQAIDSVTTDVKGRYLYAGSEDGRVLVYRILFNGTLRRMRDTQSDTIFQLVYEPEFGELYPRMTSYGMLAALPDGKTILAYHYPSWMSNSPETFTFSHLTQNGRISGKRRTVFLDTGGFRSLDFSPDSRFAYYNSSDDNGSVFRINLRSKSKAKAVKLPGLTHIQQLSFTPNSHLLCALDTKGTLFVCPLKPDGTLGPSRMQTLIPGDAIATAVGER